MNANLIGPDDPPPVALWNEGAAAPVLVVCDHAANAVARSLNNLGLTRDHLGDHIAYDPGTSELACSLAERLGAAAILAGYSRLLIDTNRPCGHPQSIVTQSDGVDIPGNHDLSEADREQRAKAFFWPYHAAIGAQLAHLWRTTGTPPALISVHSFTPGLRSRSEARPWPVGVMSNRDRRLAERMIAALSGRDGLIVGDNQPYSGREVGFTVDTHAGAAGLPHVTFEVRQDELSDSVGVARWVELISDALAPVLAEPETHRVEFF